MKLISRIAKKVNNVKYAYVLDYASAWKKSFYIATSLRSSLYHFAGNKFNIFDRVRLDCVRLNCIKVRIIHHLSPSIKKKFNHYYLIY